ncbi:SDR family NAD(P)-dependent oxidoreductase [Candidatus Poriferisocius sp.]|uniref:SDR family NAD(P)-dependent oxidoreductase n=1 Tax=Candidatus Poriferisocius sp. TaxID=3101276 RepID=UPI003B020F25
MREAQPFKNRVVIVTGASRGVGRATAIRLGEQGAAVACVARATDATRLKLPGTVDETARAVNAAGGEGLAVPCDLSKPDRIEAMVNTVMAHFGGIDALVNNAAVTFAGDLDLELKRYELTFAINTTAPLLATRLCRPHLADRNGRIVNVSSAAALAFYSPMMAYGMSKIALEHLTVSSAAILAGDKIAVNCFRIDTAVASEGFMMNSPDADHSTWVSTAVAAEGIVWMLSQPTTYTGRLESMVALARREGIMAEIAHNRGPDPSSPWSLDRARGLA